MDDLPAKAVCCLLLCDGLLKTCRCPEPLERRAAVPESPRHASSLTRARLQEVSVILAVQPTVDSYLQEDVSSGQKASVGAPPTLPPPPTAHSSCTFNKYSYRIDNAVVRSHTRFRSAGDRATAAGQGHSTVVEDLRLCQRIPRPSETVTSPLTHRRIPAKSAEHGWQRQGYLQPTRGEWAAGGRSSHVHRAPRTRAPVAAQGAGWQSTLSAALTSYLLVTMYYLSLPYCGVVLPPRIVSLFPESQKAGACHRCFIVSLQIILFLVFLPTSHARVPTQSDG